MQEFHYAHTSTKAMLNNVFNSHFYGVPLWDLFSSSFKRLLSLPHETHKFMIESLSKRRHIIFSLRKHFLKFFTCIAQSEKSVLLNVLNSIQHDSRSVTGRNLRKIMITTNQDVLLKNINEVMYNPPYWEIPPGESWRVSLVQEILEAKQGKLQVQNFKLKELDEIICCACWT